MNIRKVIINNMLCFANNQVLEFKEPVYQIVGEKVDTENSSNGSGKSSIYYIIQEILYGNNLKKTLKEFTGNIFSDDPTSYSGSVYLEHKGKEYEVTLARRKGKATLKVIEDGTDISKHTVPDTYKMLATILPDYELFTMLSYLSPTISTPNVLFLGTPKEKKDIFTKLFNLETIVKIVDKASTNVTISKTTERSLQDKMAGMKSVTIPEIGPMPDEIGVKELEKRKNEITEELGGLAKSISEFDYWNKISNDFTNTKLWLNSHVFHEDFDPLMLQDKKSELGKFSSVLYSLQQKAKELKSAKINCPMCGQLINDPEHIKTELETISARIETGESKVNSLQEEITNLMLKESDNSNYNLNKEKYVKLKEQLEAVKLTTIEDLKETKYNLELERNSIDIQLLQLRREIEEWNKTNAVREHAIELNKKNDLERELIVEEIENIKESVKPEIIIAENLGYTGFLTQRIKNMAGSLTSIINEYLNVLSDGSLCIKFIPTDKLLFTLLKDGKELPINNLSAGQLTMLQLSSILALRDLVAANKGITIDLLVLDELFGTLDEIRRGILIDIMRQISIKGGQHILSISHLYNDNSLPTIIVRQDNGVTRIIT